VDILPSELRAIHGASSTLAKKNSKSNESWISNPEIRNLKLDGAPETAQSNLRFRISGFEIQDSFDFQFFVSPYVS
jgi:hypothetical protein